jgi:lycopene cyclase domain-containing protein
MARERRMTYRAFLAVVLLPLAVCTISPVVCRGPGPPAGPRAEVRRSLALTGVLIVVAVVWTTPWDRWLIVHGVWGYPPGSVLATVARVPVEEYTFMAVQTVLAACWTLFVSVGAPHRRPAGSWRRTVCCAAWLAVAGAGLLLATRTPTSYLGAILLWFGLPLALQAAAGADVLRAGRRERLAGLLSTPPLWAADALAIHSGAWYIGERRTVGWAVAGLPVEEAVFFLVTNLLVVNSIVLVRSPAMRARLPGRR